MICNILFVGLVAYSVTISPICGAAVPLAESNVESKSANRFTYIGSSKNLVEGTKGKRSSTYQESLYYLSQNAARHEMANLDCVNIFGADGSLVSIETLEELGNITEFLRSSGDSGTLYWTSGRFNNEESVFEWGNGVKFSPTARWSPGHPNSQLSVTRVVLYTVGSPRLRTQFNTVSSRYICEVVLQLALYVD